MQLLSNFKNGLKTRIKFPCVPAGTTNTLKSKKKDHRFCSSFQIAFFFGFQGEDQKIKEGKGIHHFCASVKVCPCAAAPTKRARVPGVAHPGSRLFLLQLVDTHHSGINSFPDSRSSITGSNITAEY